VTQTLLTAAIDAAAVKIDPTTSDRLLPEILYSML